MLKEILALLVSALPGWALLALDVWDRLRRWWKNKRSDVRREDAE